MTIFKNRSCTDMVKTNDFTRVNKQNPSQPSYFAPLPINIEKKTLQRKVPSPNRKISLNYNHNVHRNNEINHVQNNLSDKKSFEKPVKAKQTRSPSSDLRSVMIRREASLLNKDDSNQLSGLKNWVIQRIGFNPDQLSHPKATKCSTVWKLPQPVRVETSPTSYFTINGQHHFYKVKKNYRD